ncbi:hypothetical protein ASE85_14630 [Sphingobium sp. Leaf26]|nr:hypothetical protein ASE85_14630 [Sphingobium sp. Leaf26]
MLGYATDRYNRIGLVPFLAHIFLFACARGGLFVASPRKLRNHFGQTKGRVELPKAQIGD